MRISRLAVAVTVVVSMSSVAPPAGAGEQQFSGSFAGSIISTTIDTNDNHLPAVLFIGRGKTNFGLTTFQSVSEALERLPEVNACPKGNLEFPWLMGHGIIQFDDSLDQLFIKLTAGVACSDPVAKTFTSNGKGVFEGGTGRFANATGSFETTSTGRPLVMDRAGHEFDSMTGQFTGIIITP